jgi:hypothetical protein
MCEEVGRVLGHLICIHCGFNFILLLVLILISSCNAVILIIRRHWCLMSCGRKLSERLIFVILQAHSSVVTMLGTMNLPLLDIVI